MNDWQGCLLVISSPVLFVGLSVGWLVAILVVKGKEPLVVSSWSVIQRRRGRNRERIVAAMVMQKAATMGFHGLIAWLSFAGSLVSSGFP